MVVIPRLKSWMTNWAFGIRSASAKAMYDSSVLPRGPSCQPERVHRKPCLAALIAIGGLIKVAENQIQNVTV